MLDYQTQQYRLFPQIARAFAFALAGISIREMYHQVIGNINSNGDGDGGGNVSYFRIIGE